LQTGQVKWKQEAFKGHVITEPVLNGNYLVIGDSLGYVHTLSKKDGQRVGIDYLGSAIDISPLQSDGQLLFITADGALSASTLKAAS
jgi:outer membrane protein assembly factor BamB